MRRVYGIRQLELATGVPRTTIYFYLRQGLLPRPQKSAASRSLYTEDHVTLLRRVVELKKQGLSLAEIEQDLAARPESAGETGVDLAAQEHRKMRDRIIALATAEFEANGYKNTHVTTMMRTLGITATTFYSHFPSKRRLLGECAAKLMDWSGEFADRRRDETDDPAEAILWNLFAHAPAFDLGSAALALIRVEGQEDDARLEDALAARLWNEVERIRAALTGNERRKPAGSRPPAAEPGVEPVPEARLDSSGLPVELLALELFAAFQPLPLHNLYERYGPEKLLEAHLWLFLAVQAACSGELDIDSRVARYKDLIFRLASEPHPLPPGPAAPYTNAMVPPSG